MISYKLSGTVAGVGTGSTGTACVSRSINIAQPPNKMVVEVSTKSVITKVKGDKVHATPYEVNVSELVPMVGSYETEARSYQFANSLHVLHCGAKAGNTYTHKGQVGLYFDQVLPVLPPWDEDIEFAISVAKTKALADLNRSYVNAPLLFAERAQTVKTIGAHMRTISQTVEQLHKQALKRYSLATSKAQRRRIASDIANEHLAVLFGLLPLIDEVKGAVNLLMEPESVMITGRGRMAKLYDETTVLSDAPAPNWAYVWERPWFTYTSEVHLRESARVSISVTVESKALQTLRSIGFNPMAAAYDLVPLSFLANFVSNVGTFLKALDPTPGTTFLTGNISTWRECVSSCVASANNRSIRNPDGTGYSQTGVASGRSSGRVMHHLRVPLTEYPDAELQWMNNMTWPKAVTVVALAVQRYYKPLKAIKQLKQFRYKGPRPKYLPPIKYSKY